MLTNVLLKVKQYVSYKGTKREVNCSKYQRYVTDIGLKSQVLKSLLKNRQVLKSGEKPNYESYIKRQH